MLSALKAINTAAGKKFAKHKARGPISATNKKNGSQIDLPENRFCEDQHTLVKTKGRREPIGYHKPCPMGMRIGITDQCSCIVWTIKFIFMTC